ncbi:MAG TPA: tetratricopeptide repeat protein [Fimbriimonadaceae bacterium]|nr:tetratricopeptide repeat protein [Fimbriimonadaceae bacterium]
MPKVLIVQHMEAVTEESDPNAQVAQLLAHEMEQSGRVQPIVWSLSDPLFREAVSERILPDPPDHPSVAQARDAARRLRAQYLLMFKAVRDTNRIVAELTLYRGDRSVWTDKKDLSVLIGNALDVDSGSASLARTWNALLDGGPFRSHPPKPQHVTPEPDPGQSSTSVSGSVGGAVDSAVLEEAAQLTKAGRRDRAILLLRDAVDASPLDPLRRKALIEALMEVDPALAAAEAGRAADVLPESAGLRAVAARAWLLAGNREAAEEELKAALTRDPENPEVLVLVARAQLANLDLAAALRTLEKLASNENPEVQMLRAFARALGGSHAEAQKVLGEAAIGEGDYPLAIDLCDRTASSIAAELRSLTPKFRLNGVDKSEREGLSSLRARLAGTLWLAERLNPPHPHASSHERRLLALKLLRQSLDDAGTYLDKPDEGLLSESAINLGEALKHLSAAREQFRRERAP